MKLPPVTLEVKAVAPNATRLAVDVLDAQAAAWRMAADIAEARANELRGGAHDMRATDVSPTTCTPQEDRP